MFLCSTHLKPLKEFANWWHKGGIHSLSPYSLPKTMLMYLVYIKRILLFSKYQNRVILPGSSSQIWESKEPRKEKYWWRWILEPWIHSPQPEEDLHPYFFKHSRDTTCRLMCVWYYVWNWRIWVWNTYGSWVYSQWEKSHWITFW